MALTCENHLPYHGIGIYPDSAGPMVIFPTVDQKGSLLEIIKDENGEQYIVKPVHKHLPGGGKINGDPHAKFLSSTVFAYDPIEINFSKRPDPADFNHLEFPDATANPSSMRLWKENGQLIHMHVLVGPRYEQSYKDEISRKVSNGNHSPNDLFRRQRNLINVFSKVIPAAFFSDEYLGFEGIFSMTKDKMTMNKEKYRNQYPDMISLNTWYGRFPNVFRIKTNGTIYHLEFALEDVLQRGIINKENIIILGLTTTFLEFDRIRDALFALYGEGALTVENARKYMNPYLRVEKKEIMKNELNDFRT